MGAESVARGQPNGDNAENRLKSLSNTKNLVFRLVFLGVMAFMLRSGAGLSIQEMQSLSHEKPQGLHLEMDSVPSPLENMMKLYQGF